MTLVGTWENAYHSKVVIDQFGDLLVGIYSSTTGSTGSYLVLGYQQKNEPSKTSGQAAALAIEWHSLDGGQGDASWHWTSGLSGQLSLQDTGETLVLGHVLTASTEFSGLVPQPGNYIDKLTYTRTSAKPEKTVAKPELAEIGPIPDPLWGTWRADDGTTMKLQVSSFHNFASGWVMGDLTTGGKTYNITGFTDINAKGQGLALQAASLVARLGDNGPAVAYSGTLKYADGLLTMIEMTSQATGPKATYVQTRASGRVFRKVS